MTMDKAIRLVRRHRNAVGKFTLQAVGHRKTSTAEAELRASARALLRALYPHTEPTDADVDAATGLSSVLKFNERKERK